MFHRTPAWRASVVTAALVAVLTGCGQEAQPASGAEAQPASGADDLVLRVEEIGGYVKLTSLITRLPTVSVYADGRVLTEVPPPLDAVYPLPALGVVQVHRINPAGIATLVQLAREAGVGQDLDVGTPMVTDNATTRFVVVTDDGRDQLDVYALRDEFAGELTPDQQDARAELTDLIAALTDLPATLGAGAVTAAEPYRPLALAAVVEPWTDPGPQYGALTDVPWPGPDLPGDPVPQDTGVSCLPVNGAQADAALQAGASASAATPWASTGQRWTIALRPLLPDENGCEDLQLSW